MTELSLTVERTFAVDRDTMWQLWTNEAHASRWMRPSLTDYGPTRATIDARVGGQCRFELMHGGTDMSVIVGEYLEVEAPEQARLHLGMGGRPSRLARRGALR